MVDRASPGWEKWVEGMLPLVETDSIEALNVLIATSTESGIFEQRGPHLVLVEMADDQDVGRFIELGRELQSQLDQIEHALQEVD